jgi:hypothetical protein
MSSTPQPTPPALIAIMAPAASSSSSGGTGSFFRLGAEDGPADRVGISAAVGYEGRARFIRSGVQ